MSDSEVHDNDEGDWRDTVIDAAQARHHPETAAIVEKIGTLRHSIDNIDTALICLLAERFHNTDAIGRLKADAGFAPEDGQREHAQLARFRDQAAHAGLDGAIAERLFSFVVDEAKQRHQRIADAEVTGVDVSGVDVTDGPAS